MQIKFSSNIPDYRNKVEELLLKKEACNNLMLGLINYFHTTISKDLYLGYILEGGKVIYAFMQTPPNHWILADVDNVDEEVIKNLATFLYKRGLKVPGVNGPISKVNIFIKEWSRLKKVKAKLHMNQLVYQLDEVKINTNPNGELVQAKKKDHSLVKSWLIHFGKETGEGISDIRASQMATKYIENKSLYLWIAGGEAVCMTNQSGKTKHGVSINAVYTPGIHKGKGYATNLVATVSQKLLMEGNRFCCLYTDKENHTSNYVYKKIGYYEVGETAVYRFG